MCWKTQDNCGSKIAYVYILILPSFITLGQKIRKTRQMKNQFHRCCLGIEYWRKISWNWSVLVHKFLKLYSGCLRDFSKFSGLSVLVLAIFWFHEFFFLNFSWRWSYLYGMHTWNEMPKSRLFQLPQSHEALPRS